MSSDHPLLHALRRRRRVRSGLVQLGYVLGGAILGQVVARMPFGAGADSARTVQLLAGISGGLLTLIGIVTSLLFLVVQFAMTSQSPRLNLFRKNPVVVHTFGFFIGNLVYSASAAIAAIQLGSVSIAVPIVSITLLILGLIMLRFVQLSAFRAVQLAPILEQIVTRGRATLDAMYARPYRPPGAGAAGYPPTVGSAVRWNGRQAVLRQIDMPALMRTVRQANASAYLHVLPGDLLREDAVVMTVHGDATLGPRLLPLFDSGIERSFDQDPTFAFRLLADIGLRAISSAINDPATGVQAVDEIEGLLRALVGRELEIGEVSDDAGVVRVRFAPLTWEQYLERALDELIEANWVPPSVQRRLSSAIENLLEMAPEERRPALEKRRAALGSLPGPHE